MALIRCYDCGAKVSLQGDECKKCGAPLDYSIEMYEYQKQRKSHIRGYVIGVLAILIGLATLVNGGFLAFLVLVLAGLLIIPATNQMIENFNPYDTGGLLKGIGWVLLVLGFIMAMGVIAKHNAENPTPAQNEPVKATQAQSSPTPAQTPTTTNNGAVESESRQIPFNECVGLQKQSLLAVAGTGYKTSVVVDSSDLSVVRICTNDGSVLITCSRLDGKMVTTKSPHCP